MSPGSRSVQRLTSSLYRSSNLEAFVCSSCRRQLPQFTSNATPRRTSRRSYATAAAHAPISQTLETSTSQLTPANPSENPQPKYTIRAGILLSRPPLLTAPLTSFEKAFYFYQRRLNERLVLPFSQYFYFKKGTPAYEDWKARRRDRGGVATRDIGKYNAYNEDAWHDEAIIGDKESEPETLVRKLVEEEGRERFPTEEDAKDLSKPLHGLRRISEADRKNDTKSLERALDRTLYLLVKRPRPGAEKGLGYWQFPSGDVEGLEGLREAAERVLDASCGPNMNTWFIANHPVGHFIYSRNPQKSNDKDQKTSQQQDQENASDMELGQKTFFIKSRILAGQADIQSNTMNIMDYQWLSKDEIEKCVAPQYWRQVKNMLAER